MNTAPTVQGWCPGALRPMTSGDGLVVRVRPRSARLTRKQALGLCILAKHHGIGLLDLTNRANLQIRGVSEQALEPLQQGLAEVGLLDETPEQEQRRNFLVAPDWTPGGDTDQIARGLLERLHDLPELPAKVGFAIDAGVAPILSDDSADFRIERGTSGRLLLRADGRPYGMPLESVDAAVSALVRLAHWFADSGGNESRRMRHHQMPLPGWFTASETAAPARAPLKPGSHMLGLIAGLPFGQIEAEALLQVLKASPAKGLRLTPWRCLLLEGVNSLPALPGREFPAFLTEPDDPLLRVQACAGAPRCSQATVATRSLAARLAPRVKGTLHVSGCAKGCACPSATETCLTGRDGQYDLAFQAQAGDPPQRSALTEAEVLKFFGDA
ncbi:MAG: cobalamin biosynthesis protein CobG [Natronospirillum sp.]|uniref:cobalamin biosynthesis protein CobG n=1 Tax=Natronospirillum sp. TaxID=2812955 RepID=UPI0025E8E4CE|nr:cobalamin biosynthesis protein CobG [Natronospirillum sp.]MCH8553135.1 cobalamin biosynthesis protein CobG [Natronospirillum sp.]